MRLSGTVVLVVGNEKSTTENAIHAIATAFATEPIIGPNVQGAVLTTLRLEASEMLIGTAYETPRHIVAAPVNAEKAAEEPRKIRPRRDITIEVIIVALMGISSVLLTLDHVDENGRPVRREKRTCPRSASETLASSLNAATHLRLLKKPT